MVRHSFLRSPTRAWGALDVSKESWPATPVAWAKVVRATHEFFDRLSLFMHQMSPVPGDRYGSPSAPAEPAQAAGSSDPDAMAADLSLRFRDRLRFFAARRLKDKNLAEDVAQETLRRALEALRERRVENLAAMPAFLFETARHICQQRFRSDGREIRAYQRLGESGEEEPSVAGDPLTDLISEERRDAVRRALSQLPQDDQVLLQMSYVEGLATDEIARRLNAQSGGIRVRRHRAVRRLGEILGVTKERDREQQ